MSRRSKLPKGLRFLHLRPAVLHSEHHVVPHGRPFFNWRAGDASRVRVICDDWHRFRWHKLFGNALPSEVVILFLRLAKQRPKNTSVIWEDFRETLRDIMFRTDSMIEEFGRPALRLHLEDHDVRDVDIDFSRFPNWMQKDLAFLFGPELRSVFGVHLLLKMVFPWKSRRSLGALNFEEIHELAWQCHQQVLARRRSGGRRRHRV